MGAKLPTQVDLSSLSMSASMSPSIRLKLNRLGESVDFLVEICWMTKKIGKPKDAKEMSTIEVRKQVDLPNHES